MTATSLTEHNDTVPVPSSPDEILWAVRRKFGYNEIDDPSVHEGLTQHAFVAGEYSFAMCGYKPYGLRRPVHIRLAAPTDTNPVCRKCSAVIAFETTTVSPLELIQALAAPVGRFEPITTDKHLLPERAGATAPHPVSFHARRRVRARAKSMVRPQLAGAA